MVETQIYPEVVHIGRIIRELRTSAINLTPETTLETRIEEGIGGGAPITSKTLSVWGTKTAIIAAIGTGIDHQIIIADETISGEKRKIFGLKEKIKSAFFIIFGAAATMVAAMLPLIFLVAEFVKGFAITTIIGVWIGVSITRPAYAKIVEAFSKENTLTSS